jgi:hypothetical protein
MIRSAILLVLLAGLAWWLHGEQSNGRFRQVDETFLDFLLANTRDDLKPNPSKLDRVVFVTLRESDKAEYAAWPPAPIDYHMIIKALASHEPGALVITEPLAWPAPKPQFIDQLGQTLLPLSNVILGARASSSAGDTAFAKDRLPSVTHLSGNVSALSALGSIEQAPEAGIAISCDSGLVTSPPAIGLRFNDGLSPSIEMQTLAHAARVPFAYQRVGIGPGAGLHLGDDFFIPLNNDGSFLKATVAVPEINALDLMTPNIEATESAASKTLGKGRIIVLGMNDDLTRQRAQIIAASLALPKLQVVPFVGQIAAWVIAASLALWLVWMPKTKALMRAIIFLFLALTASYLAFQSFKTWCPPAIPAALIAAGGVFARLFGKRLPVAA